MKNKADNEEYDVSYTIESEDLEQVHQYKKHRKKNVVMIIEIILAVMIFGGAVLMYTTYKTNKDPSQTVSDPEPYRPNIPLTTPAPSADLSKLPSIDDFQGDPYIMLLDTKIHKSISPHLYEYLRDYNSLPLIQKVYNDDYVDQDGNIWARAYSNVDKLAVTMTLTPKEHNVIDFQLMCDNTDGKTDIQYAYIVIDEDNETELGVDRFSWDVLPSGEITLVEGSIVYIYCMSTDCKTIFIFPISQDIITNLEGA